jgi:hypothetical protein
MQSASSIQRKPKPTTKERMNAPLSTQKVYKGTQKENPKQAQKQPKKKTRNNPKMKTRNNPK